VVVTDRSRIRTHPERAVPDEAGDILKQGMIAHVGFVADGKPVIIPMGYHYEDGIIYIHGARGGRLPRTLRAGSDVCIEVTLLDGLVASRTALYHSMNYRSVVAFGTARSVVGDAEKTAIFDRMTRRYFPGRTIDVDYHAPPAGDLKMTELLAVEIEEVNAKKRTGPPTGPEDADPDGFGTCGVFQPPTPNSH